MSAVQVRVPSGQDEVMMKQIPLVNRQSGLSLVELMVAMVIGLVISLAIFEVLQNFEGRKRTTTSINDVDQTGNFAIFALDKLIRSAGTGLVQGDGSLLGCTLTAAKGGAQVLPRAAALPAPFASVNTGTENEFQLFPLLIVPNVAAGEADPPADGSDPPEEGSGAPEDDSAVSASGSDFLVVMSGNSGYGEVPTQLTAAAGAAKLTLANTLGFAKNDLILLSGKRGDASTPCMVSQASANTPTTTSVTLAGTYHSSNIGGKEITAYYTGSADPEQSSNVTNLGNIESGNPPFVVIGASGSELLGFDLLRNESYLIAENVRSMYALYGIRNSDGSVTWTTATGDYSPANLSAAGSAAFNRRLSIKAVRIGLILRTSLLEKEEVGPASIELFSDLGDALKVTQDIPASERNYRYRTVESTIPLRNMLAVSSQ